MLRMVGSESHSTVLREGLLLLQLTTEWSKPIIWLLHKNDCFLPFYWKIDNVASFFRRWCWQSHGLRAHPFKTQATHKAHSSAMKNCYVQHNSWEGHEKTFHSHSPAIRFWNQLIICRSRDQHLTKIADSCSYAARKLRLVLIVFWRGCGVMWSVTGRAPLHKMKIFKAHLPSHTPENSWLLSIIFSLHTEM